MEEQLPNQTPLDPVALSRNLRQYLETEIEIGPPKDVDPGRGAAQFYERSFEQFYDQYEAVHVKVTTTNKASAADGPKVVFVGVGLSVGTQGSSRRPGWANIMWKQVVGSPARQQSRNSGNEFVRLASSGFPEVTEEERRAGDTLFPGQSVIYHLAVPSREVSGARFRIEASVSWRHLFHCQEVLETAVSSTASNQPG
ncbi:MAG: hypothetical protein ACE5KI_02965 [Dehalococcoidia bacterium]